MDSQRLRVHAFFMSGPVPSPAGGSVVDILRPHFNINTNLTPLDRRRVGLFSCDQAPNRSFLACRQSLR